MDATHAGAGVRDAARREALGFRWAVLDDGWQTAIGDWTPTRRSFHRAMRHGAVDRIHQAGLKAQLVGAARRAPASRIPSTRSGCQERGRHAA
jgi:hypothetical protein